jgi:hypothetical protein
MSFCYDVREKTSEKTRRALHDIESDSLEQKAFINQTSEISK